MINYVMKEKSKMLASFIGAFLLTTIGVSSPSANTDNMGVLSLDELLDLDVVTAAKVPEKITQTPAAIHVITREDLHRTGVNSIPDALRTVPGLHVYRINGTKWAVSARGFSGRFANKMLVMVDGRSIYTPLFSGVFWDVQDTMLEDIEQIEVIRGPGGTLWGTNAVNGIINIITRKSADTQGALLSVETGGQDDGIVSARYGGWLDTRTSYRIYGQFTEHSNFETVSGDDAFDDFYRGFTGFRMDRSLDNSSTLTLQGELYTGKAGQRKTALTLSPPYSHVLEDEAQLTGGYFIGRWHHSASKGSGMDLQLYYDHNKRDREGFTETLDIFDIDFQHRFTPTRSQEILWGLEYRYSNDKAMSTIDPISGLYTLRLDPENRSDNLISCFFQDRLTFADGQAEATIGTKLEYTDYTDFEWQPSLRFLWNLNEGNSLWAAITRSIRTPSRSESHGTYNAGAFPDQAGETRVRRIMANNALDSEKVMSYELGYRVRPGETLFIDMTTFYNYYHDLTGGVAAGSSYVESGDSSTYMVIPVTIANATDGESYGFELSGNWSVADWWRLNAGYTWFQFNVLNDATLLFQRHGFDENEQAQHQVDLSSYMDISPNLELNGVLSFVDSLPALDVESYVTLDVNLVWYCTESLTVSVGGRNLLANKHLEFNSSQDGIIASEVPLTLYGKLVWKY